MSPDSVQIITLLLRRERLISKLLEGVTDRRTLAQELPESRSTIYRSLESLTEEGLLSETAGHYSVTTYGRLLFTAISEFQEIVDGLQSANSLLKDVPPNNVDFRFIANADLTASKRCAPMQPIYSIIDDIAVGKPLKILLPVVHPQIIDAITRAQENESDVEIILESEGWSHIKTNQDDEWIGRFDQDHISVYQIDDEIPYGLILQGTPTEYGRVILYDSLGNLRGVIRNDSVRALRWAENVYQQYSKDAYIVD